MKYSCLLFSLFAVFYLNAQKSTSLKYDQVKERLHKNYFHTPLEAKKDAYLLKDLAITNEEISTAYQYLGYVYDLSGNADSARYFFTKRLLFNKKHFLKTAIYYQSVIDFCNWGMSYVDSNVIVKELTLGLSNINDEKFSQEKGLMFMLMGDAFLKDLDFKKAEFYFEKSFSLIKGKFVKVDYYMRKAAVNELQFDYKLANENYLKSLKVLDSLNVKKIFTYPQILNKLGHVSFMLENFNAAKQYLYESLHYQNENGFNTLSSETYLNLYYLEKKLQSNKSLEKHYLDKALEYNSGNISVLKYIYLEFKDFYSREKNIAKENEFLNKFNRLNDSIFNIEKVKVKADIESRYQFNENKKELALKEKIIQKDKNIKLTYLIGLSLLTVLIVVVFLFYFLRLKTQKKLRRNQKLLHEEQLKLMLENQRTEIIKEKIKAKVEERGKLSLELHDGIASEISALKLSLATESTLSKSEIDELVGKIDVLYSEIRNLSHNLDPDNIDFVEFSQFVANLCKQIEKSGLQTIKKLYITKRIDDLEVETLVNVYRIIQEVVTNILKHANATEVVFDVVETDDVLYIHIKDNGVGFDQKELKQGIGLKNIQKRVASFKGSFNIVSKKGGGTEVKINLPII